MLLFFGGSWESNRVEEGSASFIGPLFPYGDTVRDAGGERKITNVLHKSRSPEKERVKSRAIRQPDFREASLPLANVALDEVLASLRASPGQSQELPWPPSRASTRELQLIQPGPRGGRGGVVFKPRAHLARSRQRVAMRRRDRRRRRDSRPNHRPETLTYGPVV